MSRSHRLPILVAIAAVALVLTTLRGVGTPPTPIHAAFGNGPTVVLVHGLGSRSEHWLPTARALARRYRVVLVELPGHRESEMPEPFSLDLAVGWLDAAIAAETSDPVVVVGHSVGGLVVAAHALAHPERVRAVVLVETALRPQVEGTRRDAMLYAVDHDLGRLLETVYASFGRDSAQGAALAQQVVALDSTAIQRWVRLALTTDLSARISGLVPPALVVLSDRSWPHGEPWRETAGALGYTQAPGLEVERVDDCGHFIMLDHPRELARTIERFIARSEKEALATQ